MFINTAKGINWGISQARTNYPGFPSRTIPTGGNDNHGDNRAEDSHENENVKATTKLEVLMLVDPSSMPKTRINLGRSS
ncbi:hypothetical protein D0861_01745 [Hortaea werneckii]|uniref:Uncharacterized protein n=1 Tax=Hortaea werneckii TaxID=91943 RepID=A0A3M7FXZ0_HORWE|nr:hypothetical protein D0861_01745 [Hortaea werneckii]